MDIKKYCIWCGSRIKPDAKFCPKCGKQQIEEENQLIDWLISKTKDKLKGDAEDGLISAIKNFILSHLYGSVMAISIVIAAGVTVYANEPYIKKVNASDISFVPRINYSDESYDDTPSGNRDYDRRASERINGISTDYLSASGNGVMVSEDDFMASVAHLIADPSLGINGVFELKTDVKFSLCNDITSVEFRQEEFELEISRNLAARGYRVAECKSKQTISEQSIYSGRRTVVFSMVELNGRWYITENRITEYEVDGYSGSSSEQRVYVPDIYVDGSSTSYYLKNYIGNLYGDNSSDDFSFKKHGEVDYIPQRDIDSIVYGGEKINSILISSVAIEDILDPRRERYNDLYDRMGNNRYGLEFYETTVVVKRDSGSEQVVLTTLVADDTGKFIFDTILETNGQ